MTNEEAIEELKEEFEIFRNGISPTEWENPNEELKKIIEANTMAIKALKTQRYKRIILQEHDAEPRTMRAILDMETNDIYILETTKGFAEHMGMTIEEVK